ncbi:phenylacetate-CoA ligase [Bosea sp. CRIB-10]|uniref:phenylacetate--CoA ligase family protein n=1 Tax=Bosea sp. CRIB-10 TaxID=378404 RepID=UPI0008EA149D|nr:AMP-binding protein [Bosea sp. CRIB-10]SFD67969.1 phenylacetate-CoA ligase [Bosea sp. CRIB-10]
MGKHYDRLETRAPARREADLFNRLPQVIAAAQRLPSWRKHLRGLDPEAITDRTALARLPVLRKSDLPATQRGKPPFGGLLPGRPSDYRRLMMSPGPIFEPESHDDDPWRVARALAATGAGWRDIVLNTFSYHLTPGAWCFDAGARVLGCAVIPAGPGNSDAQLDLIEAYRPTLYAGVPDFLKILLDLGAARGRDLTSLKRAVVSGAAFPPSLQAEFRERGIDAYQCYATAECGIIAYETPAREGLVLNEDIIVEILRPGTGQPVAEGEVGEITVTILDPKKPLIRFAVGDLTATLPGLSPCGRTNQRIRGWLGRADQSAKVKGMFVRPEQVAVVAARHPELGRCRLVVTRAGETDAMCFRAEATALSSELAETVKASVREVFKLSGTVELVAPGTLPSDGKVIDDTRPPG